jgi:hypothetical protein
MLAAVRKRQKALPDAVQERQIAVPDDLHPLAANSEI